MTTSISPLIVSYRKQRHASARTRDFIFNQLIPYIGNKRKLLDLISSALAHTESKNGAIFLDLFSGSGVVSRLAKKLGYRVFSNDWEPYSNAINSCYIVNNKAPDFVQLGGYEAALETLNSLDPRVGWITEHLCPQDDTNYDTDTERMFFMRKNGMRIDAIRHQIHEWYETGVINECEKSCLIAPLLYQACYTSNTSGVFKGFHKGWGGQTKTALYRIAGDLWLSPAVFCDNGAENRVLCDDAQKVAEDLKSEEVAVAYLDPPYNQHPYGSNYHVLNTITLWDSPSVSKTISPGTKSAIRVDWRTARRSPYNHREDASLSYAKLLETINSRCILTSYSTEGFIPLESMLKSNLHRGDVRIEMQGYKRYRVSSQRFSKKPMNVEFVIVVDTHKKPRKSLDELYDSIVTKEARVLSSHPEGTQTKDTHRALFGDAVKDHLR